MDARIVRINRVLRSMKEVAKEREYRLDRHVGERKGAGCEKCKWEPPQYRGMTWGVQYCAEAERLEYRWKKVKLKATALLLILENSGKEPKNEPVLSNKQKLERLKKEGGLLEGF